MIHFNHFLPILTLILFGCSQSINNTNEKKLTEKTQSKTTTDSILCSSETVILKHDTLRIETCEDLRLDYWENVIASKIYYRKQTIDLIELYEKKFKSKAENLQFIAIKKEDNRYFSTYFYRGCVDDLCTTVLKVEFTINQQKELIIHDLFDFDEETETRLD